MPPVTGAQLRAEREAAGITQQQLAATIGRTRATIIAWEARAVVADWKAALYREGLRKLSR